ncbi:MAG: DNA/RNA nuclease SfsA [Candidatus Bathyarchaeia archaeon]
MGSFIEVKGRLRRGVFLERPNRFLVMVKIEEVVVSSFLPNPGRLGELLFPGSEVLLSEVSVKRHRKTKYDLIGVILDDQVVSVDTRVPNRLVLEALRNRELDEFLEYNVIRPEYRYSHSRIDFFLANDVERCLLEVKSCTLVVEGVAIFPDAPTERGRRHLSELIKAKREGWRACILFVVQRSDAQRFAPNDATDPAFGALLRKAVKEGIEVYAYVARFIGHKIMLNGKIEVELKR